MAGTATAYRIDFIFKRVCVGDGRSLFVKELSRYLTPARVGFVQKMEPKSSLELHITFDAVFVITFKFPETQGSS